MSSSTITTEAVRANLLEFLGDCTGTSWSVDQDLFESGSFSSLFALELVLHVESAFDVAVGPDDLRLEHFRTVNTMTRLVLRLRKPAP